MWCLSLPSVLWLYRHDLLLSRNLIVSLRNTKTWPSQGISPLSKEGSPGRRCLNTPSRRYRPPTRNARKPRRIGSSKVMTDSSATEWFVVHLWSKSCMINTLLLVPLLMGSVLPLQEWYTFLFSFLRVERQLCQMWCGHVINFVMNLTNSFFFTISNLH